MQFNTEDIENLESRNRALFINSLSGFKSANLIGTCDDQRNSNLAVISSVVHIGFHPPLLAMIIRPHSVARHTLENITAPFVKESRIKMGKKLCEYHSFN